MSDSFSTNPNLLNPLNTGQNTVAPLMSHTKALPVVKLPEPKHFICSMLNHHMTRTDGKRLAFIFGHCKTEDKYDVEYFNNEIETGNPYIRVATDKEVEIYNMRMDPKGTMAKQITPEIEARVRQELEIKLKSEMEKRLSSIGIVMTEEQKAQFEAAVRIQASENEVPVEGSINNTVDAIPTLEPVPSTGYKLGGILGTNRIVNAAEGPTAR